MTDQTIPVASLKDFQSDDPEKVNRFVSTIGDALADIGFFALKDHGVDQSTIEDAYKISENFFSNPEHFKNKYVDKRKNGQRGFTAFGTEHAKGNDHPDLKEFWHVGREISSIPAELTSDLPENIWPDQAKFPEFKPVFTKLFEGLDHCANSLLEACSLYLNEEKDYLPSMAAHGNTILRVIHYPPIPESASPASIRAAAHEDINLITILCEATAGGLQLLERDGTWRSIHALEGQVIVDAGDMLQNITNGFFKSTTHRVVNPDNSRERRFSMPFFVHPRSQVRLDPSEKCIAKTSGKPDFPNITAGKYLEQRLREIGLSKN